MTELCRSDPKTKLTHQFGKLWRPRVRGDDPIARHPVFVDGAEVGDCLMTSVRLLSTDQDPVGVQKVTDGSSLGKKLWIRQNLKHSVIKRSVTINILLELRWAFARQLSQTWRHT